MATYDKSDDAEVVDGGLPSERVTDWNKLYVEIDVHHPDTIWAFTVGVVTEERERYHEIERWLLARLPENIIVVHLQPAYIHNQGRGRSWLGIVEDRATDISDDKKEILIRGLRSTQAYCTVPLNTIYLKLK